MKGALVLVFVLALAALALPAAASAHAVLLHTSPADGAVLSRAPRVVRFDFDDTVRLGAGNAAVSNATNASIASGPARVRGRVLVIPLRTHLAGGDYSVRWSIVSDDGHREQGVIAFAVGSGRAPPHPVLTAAAPLRTVDVIFRALFYAGLLCAAGATVFGLLMRHDLGRPIERPLSHLLFFALLLAFVGAGVGVHDATSGTRNALLFDVGVGLSVAGAAAAALAPAARRLLLVAGACALALLAVPTLAGHALDPNQPRLLSVPADLAHVAAAAVWLGGLVSLLYVVPRATTDPVLRKTVLRRFASVALGAVVVLAVSGSLRALTELRAVQQFWTTSYGNALLAKSALLAPILALAWLNRTRFVDSLRRVRRRARLELGGLLIVVAVVAVLTQLQPGRDAARAQSVPTTAAVARPPVLPPRDAVVDARELGTTAVAVARARSAVIVTLLGQDGAGVSGRTVRVGGRAAAPCGSGCYRTTAPNGPVAVTVDGRTLRFDLPATAPSAPHLLARVTRGYRSARTIVFDESLRSGPGDGEITHFELVAPDRLAYRISGGSQAVVIGGRRWDRSTSTARWIESQQTPLTVTQPYWGHATNVHLVAPHTLTFLDRSIPAWFRVTIGARDLPRQTHMTAAAHFMVDRYVGYGVPVEVSPPSR
jgi:copper transport protein